QRFQVSQVDQAAVDARVAQPLRRLSRDAELVVDRHDRHVDPAVTTCGRANAAADSSSTPGSSSSTGPYGTTHQHLPCPTPHDPGRPFREHQARRPKKANTASTTDC